MQIYKYRDRSLANVTFYHNEIVKLTVYCSLQII